MKSISVFGILFWLLVLFVFAPLDNCFASGGYTETEVIDGGSVAGNVKVVGDLHALELKTYAEWELPEIPGSKSGKIIVNDINNGLKNAVVSITNITSGKKMVIPAIRPIIDQQRNSFIPRILAILAGTTVDILNGDNEMHNIHTRSVRNQPFNLGTTYKQRISIKFDYPEMIKMSCDIHKDSYAWIVVMGHPYFDVTDRSGYFEIRDIPAGTYTFKVWHEALGKLEKEVVVRPKIVTNVDFKYSED